MMNFIQSLVKDFLVAAYLSDSWYSFRLRQLAFHTNQRNILRPKTAIQNERKFTFIRFYSKPFRFTKLQLFFISLFVTAFPFINHYNDVSKCMHFLVSSYSKNGNLLPISSTTHQMKCIPTSYHYQHSLRICTQFHT